MNPRHIASTAKSTRHRQIGRKVLKADHLAHVLSARPKKRASITSRTPSMRPRTVIAICAALIIVTALSIGGTQYYSAKSAEAQKVAAAKKQTKLEAKSLAADACRRQKLAEKSDQIGKITYDELYDGNECDK